MGGVIGLNYSGVKIVLEANQKFTNEMFDDIQTMELAALEVMNRDGK